MGTNTFPQGYSPNTSKTKEARSHGHRPHPARHPAAAAGGVPAGGIRGQFWLNVLLTILGYIPGIIHALYVIIKYK
ncbi:YqaE/Pmp3 family membrane protein [Aerophototrophica crusticola]|uniref:YqaE/Pmp3 family membrane protein n=1 Tax=Aerophototrophica crusticola TaxID=1709002 RepID=UPI00384EE019